MQDQAAVHHILAGSAQMHIALGFGCAAGNLLAQRLDQRDRRVAGTGDGQAQRCKIVEFCATRRCNRGKRRVRNHPDPGLRPGQCRFDVEHGLYPAMIAKHLPHSLGRKVRIEQLITHKPSLESTRHWRAQAHHTSWCRYLGCLGRRKLNRNAMAIITVTYQ